MVKGARVYSYGNPDEYSIGPRFVVGGDRVCESGEHHEFMSTRFASRKLRVVTARGVRDRGEADYMRIAEIDKVKSIVIKVPRSPGSSSLSAFQKPKAQVSVAYKLPP
jgi:hypothetical protein